MEWLKDKKNLPIVVGLAAFFFIAAGGLIAFELGLFSGGGGAPPASPARMGTAPGPPGTGGAPVGMGTPMGVGTPMPTMPGAKGMKPATPPNGKTAATPATPVVVNPASGPDPFSIPGGQQMMAKRLAVGKSAKPALRDMIPVFNLFKVQVAVTLPPPPPPPPPNVPTNIQVIGIVNSAGGIYAILNVSGQSQSVKPGDSLQDGSKVTAIQQNSVSFRSSSGSVFTVPLTGGSDQPDQSQSGTDPSGMNGGQGFTL